MFFPFLSSVFSLTCKFQVLWVLAQIFYIDCNYTTKPASLQLLPAVYSV